MIDSISISEKLNEFFDRKLNESKGKIKKLKQKRKINKVIIYTSTIASIVISSITASVSLLKIPPLAVTILSISSAILTGISARFNFQDKTIMLTREIEKLSKLQNKLDYVESCNGDLTQEEYKQIISEFNF
jgi:hypothetical protein